MTKRARSPEIPKDVVDNVILRPELERRLQLYERASAEMDMTAIFACRHKYCTRKMLRIKSTYYLVSNIKEKLDQHDHRKGFLCPKYMCHSWYCKDHMPDTKECEMCLASKKP